MYKVITAQTAKGLEKAMNSAAEEGYKAIGNLSVTATERSVRPGTSIIVTTFSHMMEA